MSSNHKDRGIQRDLKLLNESEVFRSVFHSNEAVKLLIDPKSGDILDANPAAEAFYGRSRKVLVGLKITDINTLPPEEIKAKMADAEKRTEGMFIFKHRTAKGERDVEVYSGPVVLDRRELLFSIIHDVTDRLKAEQELRQSEELHRIVLTSISDAVFLTDDAGSFIYVCPNVDVVFGYTVEETESMGNIESLLGGMKVSSDELREHGEISNVEFEITDKYGEQKHVLVNVKSVNIHGATRLYTCRDYTERRHGELALANLFEEKELYRRNLEAILHSLPDGVATLDTQGRFIHTNKQFSEHCTCGGTDAEVCLEADTSADCTSGCMAVVRETLKTHKPVRDYHLTCRKQADGLREVVVNSAPLLYSSGRFSGAVLLIKDVTRLAELEKTLSERRSFKGIIGKSKVMQEIYDILERLAETDSTVLITGESGTGKEMIAEALHYNSSRAGGPMVKVNCAALSENLLESELFGHVRGSFTGADRDKIGRFQAAKSGTILLDEICEISPRIQLKLLRGLDRKEFERVGDTETYTTDARIVAATNADPAEKVRSGEFREDLLYRLKVMVIHVPPLRERQEDIPLLINHFIKLFNKQFGKSIQNVSEESMKLLMNYAWPGNIRELKNCLEHAFILCKGEIINKSHLPRETIQGREAGPPEPPVSESREPAREEVFRALEQTGGNKSKAAKLLGISRRSFYRRLERYKL